MSPPAPRPSPPSFASAARKNRLWSSTPGRKAAAYASSVVTDFMNARGLSRSSRSARPWPGAQGRRNEKAIPGRWTTTASCPRSISGATRWSMLSSRRRSRPRPPARPGRFPRGTRKEKGAGAARNPARPGARPASAPRTPLNARVTGVLKGQGYRIEKIAFESRPGFFVTAHLYVPDAAAGKRLPVIVNPHGHWGYKKQEPTVQSRLIGQALAGYLAIVVDSPGFSFEGDRPIERRSAGTHDDLRLILGSQNATSVYVWDLIRTLDYLATRPEVDMTRIGLTGASGGGLATMWAFAAEPRFTCAASVVYASSLEINPNNGCLCNHVPGSLQIGDRADVLAVRAPAPVLIIGAEEDVEFPAKGMRLTDEKLRRLWGLYGKSQDAWLRMFPGGHDYSKPMREAVLGFFNKYVKGTGDGSPRARAGLRHRATGIARALRPARPAGRRPDHAGHRPGDVRTGQIERPSAPRRIGRGLHQAQRRSSRRGGSSRVKDIGEVEGRRSCERSSRARTRPPRCHQARQGGPGCRRSRVRWRKGQAPEEFPISSLQRAGILASPSTPERLSETKGSRLAAADLPRPGPGVRHGLGYRASHLRPGSVRS